MEKSRAIEFLEYLLQDRNLKGTIYGDALNMAIEALKAQHSREGTTSDMISRQAAIDAIHCNIVVTGRENAELVAKTIGEFVDRIKALPTIQPKPQWIPVSERLPEESEYCIITANDGVGHRTTFVKYQKKAKSWELTGARSYWKVIAWMPLPTPYTK